MALAWQVIGQKLQIENGQFQMFRTLEKRPVSAAEIAALVNGAVHGAGDHMVQDVCSLSFPKPFALSFSVKTDPLLRMERQPGMVVLVREFSEGLPDLVQIVVDEPRLAFAIACSAFFERRPPARISPSAAIDPTAIIGPDVSIGPGCVIGLGVQIGEGTELRANVVVGPYVVMGRRCLVKSAAVIGEEGFGIAKTPDGRNVRIPQFGSVIIGDEVEIGSLTTVTSGTLDPVLIADRVKIDDHVHIGHNAVIGEDSIITAFAEMGRVRMGKRVWIGPNTSIKEGITICDDAFVGIGSVIIRNIDVPGVYAGVPARMLRAHENKA